MPRMWMYNASKLFSVAQWACKRSIRDRDAHVSRVAGLRQGPPTDRTFCGSDEPLIAAVFAGMTLEAFINEATDIAQESLRLPSPHPEAVVAFSVVLSELEERQAPTRDKYMAASWTLRGKVFDRGASPYQDFDVLLRLRDSLVHLKAVDKFDWTAAEPRTKGPRVLEQLESRGVLLDVTEEVDDDAPRTKAGPRAPFLSAIQTVGVAKWACNTAALTVQAVIEFAPESTFKSDLRSFMKDIKPIDV